MKKMLTLLCGAGALAIAAVAWGGSFNGPLTPNHHIDHCTLAPASRVCPYRAYGAPTILGESRVPVNASLARITVDRSAVRRERALGRLKLPVLQSAVQPDSARPQPHGGSDGTPPFDWADAAIGCAAGITLAGVGAAVGRQKRRRSAAA
jgi:hypothetical protein